MARFTRIFLTCLFLCTFSLSTRGQSTPAGAEDYPDGFWFGTQELPCVLLYGSLQTHETRVRRQISPTRNSLRVVHGLLYYRGHVYEWDHHNQGYVGVTLKVPQCSVTWESRPAGRSSCPAEPLARFTREYRQRYGPYHLIINNCHVFANRLSNVLRSENCSDKTEARPSRLRSIWNRFVSFLSDETADNDDNVQVTN